MGGGCEGGDSVWRSLRQTFLWGRICVKEGLWGAGSGGGGALMKMDLKEGGLQMTVGVSL